MCLLDFQFKFMTNFDFFFLVLKKSTQVMVNFNMKIVALKLLTVYVLLFTTISTLLIIYNLRYITSNNNGNLVLQNIICDHSSKKHILPNDENQDFDISLEIGNRVKYIPDRSAKGTDSLNEIIESIRLDNVYNHIYQDHNLWFTFSIQQSTQLKKFEFPLSFYNGPHHNLILSLLPASKKLRKSSQSLFRLKNHNDRILQQIALKLNSNSIAPKKKLILVMFDSLNLNRESLLKNQCNIKECEFTRKLSDAENADAIIFQSPQQILEETMNRRKQVWIYHNIESPVHSEQFAPSLKINWTATYRSDSVIPTPYAKFVAFTNTSKLPFKTVRNFADRKTRLAAVLISNCYAKNERIGYIRHLQKFARVDIYGKCGDQICNDESCFDMLKRDYKFYLAFENSNCRGYITEKFFCNALQ